MTISPELSTNKHRRCTCINVNGHITCFSAYPQSPITTFDIPRQRVTRYPLVFLNECQEIVVHVQQRRRQRHVAGVVELESQQRFAINRHEPTFSNELVRARLYNAHV